MTRLDKLYKKDDALSKFQALERDLWDIKNTK